MQITVHKNTAEPHNEADITIESCTVVRVCDSITIGDSEATIDTDIHELIKLCNLAGLVIAKDTQA